ncbi:MAG: hypothetical protein QOE90_2410 [Thermoplasmata archaeon]|jgi:hypothetical protein|nr:hypothetical protein [Thermoplasmata archaeon]
MTTLAPVPPGEPTPRRPWTGRALLGRNWEANREYATQILSAAYNQIADKPAENWALWQGVRRKLTAVLTERWRASGLRTARMYHDALMSRVAPLEPSRKPGEHVALVHALLTDYNDPFAEHCEYRHDNDGNVHLEITGHTGMAKSSCAISIADWLSPIEPARLRDHVNFDLSELHKRLKGKRARETVIQDEYLALSGEGARTDQARFANLEDTLRASGVNLFVLSPRRQDHATMQARLEALAWNRAQRWTGFLVWVEDTPLGMLSVPWCRPELWAEYKAFKAANTDRTLSGAFRDERHIARTGLQVLDDERVIRYLTQIVAKPKKATIEEALTHFCPMMLSATQKGQVADFIWFAATELNRFGAEFEWFFGLPPNDGLRAVADACRKTVA